VQLNGGLLKQELKAQAWLIPSRPRFAYRLEAALV
jgi:hypothetical protein